MTTKSALQKILKGILYTGEKSKHNHENNKRNKSQQTSRIGKEDYKRVKNYKTYKMKEITTYLSIIILNDNMSNLQ
jgi:hypothetical protein